MPVAVGGLSEKEQAERLAQKREVVLADSCACSSGVRGCGAPQVSPAPNCFSPSPGNLRVTDSLHPKGSASGKRPKRRMPAIAAMGGLRWGGDKGGSNFLNKK